MKKNYIEYLLVALAIALPLVLYVRLIIEVRQSNFEVYNEKGNQIYYEDSNGFWFKKEYDEKGNLIYYENSNGYWSKSEYDERDNLIHYEDSDGYWSKRKYDERNNTTCYEDSDGFWFKNEYDEKGNLIYREDADGYVVDKRIKELTIEEIERLLGYRIKIKEGLRWN